MTEQTEQTEWRSGDVVVTSSGTYWRVQRPLMGCPVLKKMCPDPQILADFIASQRPKPRYASGRDADSDSLSLVRDGMKPVVLVSNYSDDLDARTIAEHLADWLNEQEADR